MFTFRCLFKVINQCFFNNNFYNIKMTQILIVTSNFSEMLIMYYWTI